MNTKKTPIMRLKRKWGLTYAQLAKRIGGVSEAHLRKLGCGFYDHCGPALALRIEKRSRGFIKAKEMIYGSPRR